MHVDWSFELKPRFIERPKTKAAVEEKKTTQSHRKTNIMPKAGSRGAEVLAGASIPMGQGGHVPQYLDWGALSRMPPPQYF